MKNPFLLLAFLCLAFAVRAQGPKNSSFTLSGYAEVYYLYDFNKPHNNTRPGFMYSHTRSNEVNVNLAFLKGAYQSDWLRGSLALAGGTYMNASYAAEPGVLKNIFEANAGVKLSRQKNLWLDAGIFAAHIGFESAVGKDNWTLTRSMMIDNAPYYEAGVKAGYTSNSGKWYLAAMLLNGWQRIQRVDGNTTPAFGTQITYKPSSRVTLNSSTFIGNDKPDSIRQMRYFHNLYGTFQVNGHWGLTAAFDIGIEQKSKGSSEYNAWLTPVLIVRYTPDDRNAIAVRAEYYDDEHGVIVPTGTPNGFKTLGYGLNYDRTLHKHALWRIEARGFRSEDAVFAERNGSPSKNDFFIATSLCVSF